jgi:type IV pilus assembly protein PilW
MRQRGFSLVEFMVAMTIGMFLVAGLVYLIAETSRSRGEIERSSRQIENGRYALDRLVEDLRHAGFYSEYFQPPAAGEAGFPATTAAAAPCGLTAANLQAGLPLAIQAYDGGGSVPSDLSGCLDSNDYQPDTDILVVRRASTSAICPTGKTCLPGFAAAAPDATEFYIQATPLEYKLDLGTSGNLTSVFTLTQPSANNTATADVPLRQYIVHIYFISKCNVPASGTTCNGTTDDGGKPVPTLKMLELGPGPAFQKLAIAEGIEQLQFDFGVDDPVFCGGASAPADGVADCVVMCDATTPCSTAAWSNVVSATINLVARNTEPSPNYADDKTYSLGLKGYTTATGDQYRRHAYSTFVRLNNISMRRE